MGSQLNAAGMAESAGMSHGHHSWKQQAAGVVSHMREAAEGVSHRQVEPQSKHSQRPEMSFDALPERRL
jgi:hypothetical protein